MAEHAAPLGVTTLDGELPSSSLTALLAAFRAYESALMSNDVAALDAAFAPGHATLRGDGSGLLVGHERISAFRALRGGLPPRVISEIHVRVVSPTAALIISVSAPVKGGTGLQTQLWQELPSLGWVISAAHVSAPAPAVNGSVWRVAGAPLVGALPVGSPASAALADAAAPDAVDSATASGDAAGPAPVGESAGAGGGADSPAGSSPDGPEVSFAVGSGPWPITPPPGSLGDGGPGDEAMPVAEGPRPLEGVTVAVKDLYAVAGFAVGAGIPEYLAEASVATADADAVYALRAAGAALQGIAQTDEFAYSIAGRNVHYGTPPNPAVPGAIPGGSSSGPATAVALGQATVGLATDTAGSIRVPASYQGLWGIRTTHGAVSARGLLPLAESFDTVGWLTRSAAALRLAAETSLAGAPGVGFEAQVSAAGAAAGSEAVSSTAAVAAVRFAVSRDLVSGCAPEVQGAFWELLAHPLFGAGAGAGVGAGVDHVDLGDLDELVVAFRTVQGAEAWRAHGEWIGAHPGVLAPDVAERFDIASAITSAQETVARDTLAMVRAHLDAALDGRVLLLPSASSAAPALDASAEHIAVVRASTLRMTAVAGAGGYPAVSAPLMRVPIAGGTAVAPVGLCLVGARGDDLALIDLAAAIASLLGE